jgi:hypothetical protein
MDTFIKHSLPGPINNTAPSDPSDPTKVINSPLLILHFHKSNILILLFPIYFLSISYLFSLRFIPNKKGNKISSHKVIAINYQMN